ncbi:hypothetical protein [Treponema zioleckii]|uniref:hypothetical protein n=1 Tax=Treponema zioleckii TaxID=331680 RepID=UPI00168BF8A7|nr:hypothetical protein [Treponema zioleckii]
MKKKLILLIFLCISNFIFSTELEQIQAIREGSSVVFNLPYCKERGRSKYFSEYVSTALIVEEIHINGKKSIPDYDTSLYFSYLDEYKTQRVSDSEHLLCMRMVWESYKNNWQFSDKVNVFVAKPFSEVKVYYRVVYPFPFGNPEKLLWRKFKEKYVSQVYCASFTLPEIEY